MLHELGLRDTDIVARCADLTAGIQELKDDFGNYWFDETIAPRGCAHLGFYRKEWNDRLGC